MYIMMHMTKTMSSQAESHPSHPKQRIDTEHAVEFWRMKNYDWLGYHFCLSSGNMNYEIIQFIYYRPLIVNLYGEASSYEKTCLTCHCPPSLKNAIKSYLNVCQRQNNMPHDIESGKWEHFEDSNRKSVQPLPTLNNNHRTLSLDNLNNINHISLKPFFRFRFQIWSHHESVHLLWNNLYRRCFPASTWPDF